MYEDISKVLNTTPKTHFNVVMGDFNSKVGVRASGESCLGQHGVGIRNRRGQMLVNFLEKEGLFLMNSFFKKKPQRKWTWRSPDSVVRNEIDFIITDRKYIFRDVSVINRFNTGSDYRLLRGSLSVCFKLERAHMLRSTLRPYSQQSVAETQFQLQLRNRFDALNISETTMEVDELPDVSIGEIGLALKQLKGGKTPGRDGITIELLRAGGEPVLRELRKVFNFVLQRGVSPEEWLKSEVVLFFKKGDNTLLKNYRPISLF
ncbi:craniofacial development protein 2-like, partial [Aricia agestis]|uniref:craniofacial development protein 2-like n=1 Tax=Aricia agestis TaxID=91739 RepID=UPI001C205E5C